MSNPNMPALSTSDTKETYVYTTYPDFDAHSTPHRVIMIIAAGTLSWLILLAPFVVIS